MAGTRKSRGQARREQILEVARFHETDQTFIRFFVVLSAESLGLGHAGLLGDRPQWVGIKPPSMTKSAPVTLPARPRGPV